MFKKFKDFLDYIPYRVKVSNLRGFCIYKLYMEGGTVEGALISSGMHYIELLDLVSMKSSVICSNDFDEDVYAWEVLGVVRNNGDVIALDNLPQEVKSDFRARFRCSNEFSCLNVREVLKCTV